MGSMPTSKKILNFAIDANLLKRLEDFRFDNRFNMLSQAIRHLIDGALKMNEVFRKKKNAKITLAYLEGQTIKQIAKDFDMTERAVTHTLKSITVTLREALKE